ncbi:MAG: hypothetical protein JWN96_3989 [Mycobacterium sp.]|nr:hypothetical protein [Mycobacterium sp.]
MSGRHVTPSPAAAEDAAAPVQRKAGSGPAALQDEIEQLRRRNADLEQRQTSYRRRTIGILRATCVVLLMTIGAVLATASVPAIWGRNLVLNTDRYVETMAPLASNPGIQAGVVKAIDKQFDANVDISSLARDALPARADQLAGPLQSAAESLVNTVTTRFVQSPAFATLWTGINRAAHTQVVAILTGKASDNKAVTIKNDVVVLNLAPIVEQVKKQLVAAGLTVASKVPVAGATFEIAQVKGVDNARALVRLLDRVARWLPLLALLFLVSAVVISRRRRRSTVIAGASVAAGMVVIAVALAIVRTAYLNHLPGVYLSHEAAASLYDTLIRYLRTGLRLVLVGALLVCVIAWLSGPSRAARWLRHASLSYPKLLARRWADTPLAATLAANRGGAALGIFGVAALLLVLWNNPTVLVIVVIAVVALALFMLVYAAKVQPAHKSAALHQ